MKRLVPLLVIGALVVGSSAVYAQDGETLAAVRERGTLICGVHGSLPNFSVLDEETGEYFGMDADYCRAIAQAVLDDPTAIDFRPLTGEQRGPALQTGEIDVLIRNTTHTATRDIEWGNFTQTIYYDEQGFMVPVDSEVETLEDLDGATICVTSGTTTEVNLADKFAAAELSHEPIVFAETEAVYGTYEEGRCDAVTSDKSQLAARRSVFADPSGHKILDFAISKEPLGPVVAHGDEQWFNIVSWVVNATIAAEEFGVTSANVEEKRNDIDPDVRRLLGTDGDVGTKLGLENDWVAGVIAAVGNYGEIYERSFGPDSTVPTERVLNELWLNGGLLYAPPYK